MAKNETLLQQIDSLVKFYEMYKPEAGLRLDVSVTPGDLYRALNSGAKPQGDAPREQIYRGRALIAIRN